MKYKLIITILFTFSCFINAESIKDADDIFNKAQSYYNEKNFSESVKYFNNALLIYEKFEPDNKSNRGTIDIWLGSAFYNMNRMDDSISYFKESFDIFSKINDNRSLLMAINGISNAYLEKKDYEKIIYYYKIAVSIYDKSNDAESKGIYLSYIGSYYYQLKKFDSAIEYYSKAVDNYKQSGNVKETFNNLNNIGGIYFYSGNKEKAAACYSLAYETGKNFIDVKTSIQFLNNIAMIYMDIKKYDDATTFFSMITDIEKSGGTVENIELIYSNIGDCYLKLNKLKQADENYIVAYERSSNNKDENSKISLLNKIIDNSDETDLKHIKYAEELISIYQKKGLSADQARVLNNIGFNYKKSAEYDKAIDCFDKAEKLAKKTKDAKLLSSIDFNLGQFYFDIKKYGDSIDHYSSFLNSGLNNDRKELRLEALTSIGVCQMNLYNFNEALKYISIAEKEAVNLADKTFLLSVYENKAALYHRFLYYAESENYYNKALSLADSLNKKDAYAVMLNDLGVLYTDTEKYEKAIEYYTKAMEINKSLADDEEVATQQGNIGHAYYMMGYFDKAYELMKQSVVYFKDGKDREKYSNVLNNLGELYRLWGKYDRALECYDTSLETANNMKSDEMLSILYNNYGMLYKDKSDYSKAIDYFSKALELNRKMQRKDNVSTNLSNLGDAFRLSGNLDKAADYFNSALKIDRELGLKSKIAIRYNDISLIYLNGKKYDKALAYMNEAIKNSETTGKFNMSLFYDNIGIIYLQMGQYEKAKEWLNKALSLKEEIRKTAPEDMKIDYLSSQINTYQALTNAYAMCDSTEDMINALACTEMSKSKYLSERISDKFSINSSSDIISNIRNNLTSDTTIIIFTCVSKQTVPIRFMITTEGITYKALDDKFLKFDGNELMEIKKINEATRGFQILEKDSGNLSDFAKGYNNLNNLIYYYRLMLTKHDKFLENRYAVDISRTLYDYLFQDLYYKMNMKKKLMIITDNILGLLPFETLMNADRKFLIENYDIKYAHSLNVLSQLENRKYPTNRKSMISFGGAIYDKNNYKNDMSMNELEYNRLIKDSIREIRRNVTRSASVYDFLKNAEWLNLPGTLAEVKSIGSVYNDAQINTGEKVSESFVKSLSESGKLKQYRIIHFATHGMIVPDAPELSAMVLSLSDRINKKDDGFLQSKEIVNLDLNADFVNLSACETGLGKIYEGEGLVGLAQSFILAGANGVSVSLWEVDDQSTMVFMTELYRLQNEKKIGFYEAESEVKREFIKGKMYNDPYYWAPFVYFGL
jgi:tetratricopeptide (TPR) repeat protein